MLSEIVRDALREAIGHDDEVRLVKSGSNRGILNIKDRKSAKNKKAIEDCLNKKHGWFDVREEKVGKTKHWFVRITDAGVAALLAETPIAEYGALLDEAAERWRPQLLSHCAAELDRQHAEILNAQKETHNAAVEFFTTRLQNLDEQREVIAEQRETVTTIQQRLIVVAPQEPEEPKGGEQVQPQPSEKQQPQRDRLRPPADRLQAETAFEYQRDLCDQLVAAWQEAATPEARDEIEVALLNAGLDPIGEVGEVVEFDGRRHKALESIRAGEPAEIVAPGWQLPLTGFPTNAFGEGVEHYVLAKPIVRPASAANAATAMGATEDSAAES